MILKKKMFPTLARVTIRLLTTISYNFNKNKPKNVFFSQKAQFDRRGTAQRTIKQ